MGWDNSDPLKLSEAKVSRERCLDRAPSHPAGPRPPTTGPGIPGIPGIPGGFGHILGIDALSPYISLMVGTSILGSWNFHWGMMINGCLVLFSGWLVINGDLMVIKWWFKYLLRIHLTHDLWIEHLLNVWIGRDSHEGFLWFQKHLRILLADL